MNGAEIHVDPASGSAPTVHKRGENTSGETSQQGSSTMGSDANPLNQHTGWFKFSFDPSPSLENSGSVARDHLANERTWLAYIRTSLAISSTGVALVQLFTIASHQGTSGEGEGSRVDLLRRFARPLGATAVIIGMTILIIGLWRYFRVQAAVIDGNFPPARRTVGFLSSVLVVVVAVTFGFLVAVPR